MSCEKICYCIHCTKKENELEHKCREGECEAVKEGRSEGNDTTLLQTFRRLGVREVHKRFQLLLVSFTEFQFRSVMKKHE